MTESVSGVLKTSPRSDEPLSGFTGLSMQSHSWRALSQQSKISKGEKVHGAKSEETKPRLPGSSLSGATQDALNPPAPVVTGPGNTQLLGGRLSLGVQGVVEGQSREHVKLTTCKIPNPKRKSRCSAIFPVHINSSGTVSHS